MKKLLFLIPFFFFLTGYTYYSDVTPIFMDREDLEKSVELVNTPLDILNPGRIHIYNNWLLLVENYAGVHLIDNTDPAHPARRGFLRVPGCQNVVIGKGILYVDNAVDLVGVQVDLTALTAKEIARNRKALPEILSPLGYIPWEYRRGYRPVNTEIVGWTYQTNHSGGYME